MAVYDPGADLGQHKDYRLVVNTFVTLFWRKAILKEATSWLDQQGYKVIELVASGWKVESDLHRDISRALAFPDYYGQNLDALNDCMRDVVDHQYGCRRPGWSGMPTHAHSLRYALNPSCSLRCFSERE